MVKSILPNSDAINFTSAMAGRGGDFARAKGATYSYLAGLESVPHGHGGCCGERSARALFQSAKPPEVDRAEGHI